MRPEDYVLAIDVIDTIDGPIVTSYWQWFEGTAASPGQWFIVQVVKLAIVLMLCSTASAGELSWDFYRPPPPQAATEEPTPKVRTYTDAREEAIRTGKPLVVWSGDAICPNCIAANASEFVHFAAPRVSGFPRNSLTVGVPVNGELLVAGQVKDWAATEEQTDGHIPTVRLVLRRWRALRRSERRTLREADLWPVDRASMTTYRTVQYSKPVRYYSTRRFSGGG